MSRCFSTKTAKSAKKRPPDTRKHTVLPVSIRLKSTAKTPTCVSMRAFLQPISARIYFGKTASHRKRARFVQSRGASPQAYWMSVKAAQRWGCAKRAFCGVCFLMPGGLKRGFFIARSLPRCRGGRLCPPEQREALSFRASDRVTGVGIRFPVGRDPCVPPIFDKKPPAVYTASQGRCNKRQAVSHSPDRG